MYIPARKITNSGTRKNTGFFPSAKNGRPVGYESLIEKDYIYLLESDQDVISYYEQPVKILYTYKNRNCMYTPDMLVYRKNKIQLIEIKPYQKLNMLLHDEATLRKYSVAASYCKQQGYDEFKIITDQEINAGSLLSNVKYLFSYSTLNVPATIKMKIRSIINNTGSMSISDIISCTHEQIDNRKMLAYIYSMIYHHEISADLELPISKYTTVRPF